MFFALTPAKAIGEWNDRARAAVAKATGVPPQNTRARGRSTAIRQFIERGDVQYIINWDSISCENHRHLAMSDPFCDYERQVGRFLQRTG